MLTVDTVNIRHKGIKAKTVRKWIEKSKDRVVRVQGREVLVKGNGFDDVIVRVGRSIYLNNKRLIQWMESQNRKENN